MNISLGIKLFDTVNKKQVWLYSIVSIVCSIFFAIILHKRLNELIDVYHTILEGMCIFIALSLFMSVFFTFRRKSLNNCILGFGYLAVAIFDIMHSIFHFKLNLSLEAYFDLSTKFWIIGRITEAIVLLLSVTITREIKNKFTCLLFTVIYSIGITSIEIRFHDYLPVLLTEHGVTKLKTILEYIVVMIFIFALIKLKDKLDEKSLIEYKFIFISLTISILSELCFVSYNSINSISWTFGHVLKITSYYFLYRGTFISTVTYPFEKLEIEHKKLEEANEKLSYLSDTMNEVLDTLPIGIQKYSTDNKLVYVNRQFEQMMACDRNDLCGCTAKQILKKFQNENKNIVERNKELKSVFRTYRNMKGEKIKLSIKIHKIRNGTLLIANDVKKEQELENINLQTQTILNAISNGILMSDKNKKILLCNKVAEEIFEMSRNEIVGMNIDKLNKLVKKELSEDIASGITDTDNKNFVQKYLTSKMGSKKEILEYVAPISNVDSDIIGEISIITDITKMKKEQQKLIQQEKLAMLGQMGAGIVHETRNFLTTIKGSCQLISMLTKEELTKKHAESINNNVDEVNRIISEFLFLSKPRKLELIEVSLYDVFQSLRSMIETSSLLKGVDIDIRISKEERYILCDESQIKQVILNLCKNAIEAIEEKKDGKIIVDTGYDEVENEMYISITDNGKGISEETLKNLGKPFFTSKKNGTGLGLNVCYEIVHRHTGRIEVKSKLGIGTTFKVFLPCIEDEVLEIEDLASII